MSEWKSVRFSDAVRVNPSVPLKRGVDYPFVEMQDVNQFEREAKSKQSRPFTGGGSRFAAGDTLMARITPCLENGKTARFVSEDDEAIAHGSTEFIVIRGRPSVTDTDFAYYLTRWREVQDFAISQMTGSSGRQRVPTSVLSNLIVPIPPLPEQHRIADILGTLDDKIELNRKMNETLEAMARALFKSWFVDFDPVVAKSQGRQPDGMDAETAKLFPSSFEDSELGRIPKGWRVGTVSNLATLSRDAISPNKFPDELFDHYSLPAFDDGRLPKAEFGGSIMSNKFLLPKGCVLLSKLNPRIPRVWMPVMNGQRRALSSTEFLVCRPAAGVSREFLYLLFSSAEFGERFATFVTGTSGSHQRVKPESLLNTDFVLLPNGLIGEFTKVIAPLLMAIGANIGQSRELSETRDVLLPKMLSGQVRLRNVNVEE